MSGALQIMLCRAQAGGRIQTIPSGTNPTSCSFELQNDGDCNVGDGAGGVLTSDWVTVSNALNAAGWQVKTDVTGGSFNTDPSAGSYIALSSTRTWTKLAAGVVTFTITFRDIYTGSTFSQAGITMTVT